MIKEGNKKICLNCGAEINIENQICPECGFKQPVISHFQKVSKLWWLVPLFFGVIGGLTAWLVNRERNPKTAMKLLIFGIAWPIFVMVIYFLFFGILMFSNLGLAKKRAKEASLKAAVSQIRMIAATRYEKENSYEFLNCNDLEIYRICKQVEEAGGKLTILSSDNKYCAYTPLLTDKKYFCVDSEFKSGETETFPPCEAPDYSCKIIPLFDLPKPY